jgi:hypothetical protein
MTITPEQIDQINNRSSRYKSVFLTEGKLDSTDAAQIAKALQDNNNVVILYLSHNQIGNAGTINIAKSLESNQTIRCLNLVNNGINDEGAQALSNALNINPFIVEVDLGENNISANLLNEINGKLIKNIINFAEHAHSKIKSCDPTQTPDKFFQEIELACKVLKKNFTSIETLYSNNFEMLKTWLELIEEMQNLVIFGRALRKLEENPIHGLRQYTIISQTCDPELVKAEILLREKNTDTHDQETHPFKDYFDKLFKINQWKDNVGQNSMINVIRQLETLKSIKTDVVIYPYVKAVIENIYQDLQILIKSLNGQASQGTFSTSISFVTNQIANNQNSEFSLGFSGLKK